MAARPWCVHLSSSPNGREKYGGPAGSGRTAGLTHSPLAGHLYLGPFSLA